MSLGLKAISQYGVASLAARAFGPLTVTSDTPISGAVLPVRSLSGTYEGPGTLSGATREPPRIAARRGRL